MKLKEAYGVMQAEWVRINDVQAGDKFKLLRGYGYDELGCNCFSCREDFGDGKGVVVEIGTDYIVCSKHCNGDTWNHPFFALEIIEKAKNENMITVKGKKYSEDTLDLAIKKYVNE